jgi:hypothetical protein
MSDLQCPYCNAPLTVNHDDGIGYAEDFDNEMECCHCDKAFKFTCHISYAYEAKKADCMNTGNHDWKEWRCVMRDFRRLDYFRRNCKICGYAEDRTQPAG